MLKILIFWVVTLCGRVNDFRRFEEAYSLTLEDKGTVVCGKRREILPTDTLPLLIRTESSVIMRASCGHETWSVKFREPSRH
jgi:hypothetical protein